MIVEKKNVVDRGDGTIELCYEASPADLPLEFRNAPVRSRFVLVLKQPYSHRAECLRSTTTDAGNGKIKIKLIILSGSIPDEMIYVKTNTKIEIDIEPSPDNSESNLPLTTDERIKTLKMVSILSSDPSFWTWITDRHPFIKKTAIENPELTEEAVTEAIRREIEAHSRSEILSSAIIAERAQIMIKRFRKSLWANKEKEKEKS